jgi:hypothetical protein
MVFWLAGFTSSVAQDAFTPGGIESVGVTRIVPDTIMFPDPAGQGSLGNWEPYSSVLGNSVFLIACNTYAESDDPAPEACASASGCRQRYGLTLQKVDGGDPVFGECFFADDGAPYRGVINHYRENGNPARVAGDTRPGAVNFITGGETAANEFVEFQSDNRWELGLLNRMGRFATVQTFCLNPLATLSQKSKSKAFDAINGRLTEGDLTGNQQIGRFGGELTGLDNGNFVVVVDDRSGLHNMNAGTATTAVIVAPDGSIVKESFVINNGDIWSNAAAFKGGFCVRQAGVLRFYDNDGDPQGEADQAPAELVEPLGTQVVFDRGRGDATRIASHINTPYVYLVGVATSGPPENPSKDVRLAAWDSRDLKYVGQVNVNELTAENGGTDDVSFRPGFDRANLAVDALNRIVVTYEVTLESTGTPQTAARVLELQETTQEFKYLTKTFFPFVNHSTEPPAVGGNIRTWRPSPAMTTKEILVAAKGEINSDNFPENGSDTPVEVNFYTVLRHPDPKDDPTGVKGSFLRGDANNDGKANLSDSVFLLGHLFLGGPRWVCEEAAEINKDGRKDLSDAVFLLSHLFLGTPAPQAPFPACGSDPGGATCPASRCNQTQG